jgi:hypothetical protein
LLVVFAPRRAHAILNGQPDRNSAFVLALENEYLEVNCTATLIAPNLVVTARHCVDRLTNPGADCSTTRFYTESPSDSIYLSACPVFSSSCQFHRSYKIYRQDTVSVCNGDLALIVTGDNFPPTEATPIVPDFSQGKVGQVVTALGFGLSVSSGPDATWGTRRSLSGVQIECVAATDPAQCAGFLMPGPLGNNEFGTSGGACSGDSGGPVIVGEQGALPRILGVVSRAEYAPTNCGPAVYVRMDGVRPMVLEAAKWASERGGYPLPTWALDVSGEACTPGEDCSVPSSSPASPASSGCSLSTTRETRVSDWFVLAGGVVVGGAVLRRRQRSRRSTPEREPPYQGRTRRARS